MSTPADGSTSDAIPVGVVADAPEVAQPDDQLLLRNDDLAPAVLTVVRRRGDVVASDTVEAEPLTTYGVPLPAGTGSTVIEVHTATATATTSVGPDERPPLLSYREGAVLVARD